MQVPKLLLLVCALLYKPLCAQDIAAEAKNLRTAAKENPIAINGALSASALAYKASGIAPRRDPFYYVLSANLNITVLNKVTIPFTSVFTQFNTSYTNGLERYAQPFSQFGCSPSYKWLTLHIGYRSLSYNEYSLNGLLFLGGGLEIKPKKSIFSGMASYGRFVHNAPVEAQAIPSVFERWGGAVKLRAAKNENFFELIAMQLKDYAKQKLISVADIESPKENVVVALQASQKIHKHFKVDGEYAYSMYSENITLPAAPIDNYTYINRVFTSRSTSRYSSAGTAGLAFDKSQLGLGLKYKRVAPDYFSLGSPFITNDVEEISGSVRTAFLKNKLQLQTAIGAQRNNLDNKQQMQSRRLIASISTNYVISEKINAQAFYSNFSSNSRLVRDSYSDSLRIVQVNESANSQISYSSKSKNSNFQVSGNVSYQNSKVGQQATNFISQQITIQNTLSKRELTFSLFAMHGTMKQQQLANIRQLSTGTQFQKAWKNGKYKINFSSSTQFQAVQTGKLSTSFSHSLDLSFVPKQNTSFSLQAQFLNRRAQSQSVQSFSEERISVIIKQNFQAKKKK